jgi:aldehyde:ferredoxin oxidoreductase
MSNGYWQKLLRVDLTNKKTSIEPIAEEDLKRFIGGAGLAAEILRREVPAKTDAHDPKNLVIFGAGPFQGPPIAGGAKFSIAGISPVTGTFGDTAAGADWGPALKDAGYDMLVIEGASETPIYLHIVDDRVEIRDASNLTGMDTHETIDAIHKETEDKKLSIASIGPAGEKRVAIACIVVDKHSFAGRCGLGAVMGSKGLKAVAVRGTQTAEMSDPDKARELMGHYQKQILATVKENEFRTHGTAALCESAEALGDMPIKYWAQDVWPEGAKKLGAPNCTKVLNAKPYPCKFCPIGCHRKITITEPAEYAQEGIGPEYETLGMMGTNLLIDDPKAVAQGNDMANRLGLDTISAGAMVGFAMECFEKGWITDRDTDGLELKWGDPKVLFALLEQIGNKEGFGAIFSEGTLPAAEKISQEAVEIVAHCKGLDFPAHDARSCISLAPTYATGTRGACHFRGACEDVEMGGFFIPEIGIKEGMFKFFERENQSLLAAKCQDYFALLNSLVLCAFMVDGGDMPFSGVKDLFNAITGWGYSIEDLIETGERIFAVQRLINIRDGYNAATDVMPKKMLQPAKEGFRAGKIPPFKELMEDYYNLRGWDENGEPSQRIMDRLGLAK